MSSLLLVMGAPSSTRKSSLSFDYKALVMRNWASCDTPTLIYDPPREARPSLLASSLLVCSPSVLDFSPSAMSWSGMALPIPVASNSTLPAFRPAGSLRSTSAVQEVQAISAIVAPRPNRELGSVLLVVYYHTVIHQWNQTDIRVYIGVCTVMRSVDQKRSWPR